MLRLLSRGFACGADAVKRSAVRFVVVATASRREGMMGGRVGRTVGLIRTDTVALTVVIGYTALTTRTIRTDSFH